MKGIQEAFTAAQAGGASDIKQIRQKARGWKISKEGLNAGSIR